MTSDHLRYVVADGIASIALDRPEALNALDVDLKVALIEALTYAAVDDSVRAVVIGGIGRAFCVGQDLAEHATSLAATAETGAPGDTLSTVTDHYIPIIEAITTMPKPVIASVNGVAAGAGVGIALACDFRIAVDTASFAVAFSRIGLAPDSGASWTLTRLVGSARALALLILAEPVSAENALELGLVNAVVPADALPAAVADLAARLAAGPTVAYAETKALVGYAGSHSLGETLRAEAEAQSRCGATEDHCRAVASFLAKETPTFTGA